jgi:hypothetical protein
MAGLEEVKRIGVMYDVISGNQSAPEKNLIPAERKMIR